jgi:ERCC4-type nuclease
MKKISNSNPNMNNNKSFKNKKNEYNIIVNTIQLKNPIIREFFFGYNSDPTIPCDFKIADKYFCFFLSMKYHQAFPTYIENKLSQFILQNTENDSNCIKFLFCVYDLTEGKDSTKEIKKTKIRNFLENFRTNSDMSEDSLSENIFSDLIDQTEDKNSNNSNHISSASNNNVEKLLTDLNFICLNNKTTFILCYSGYDLSQYLYSLSQMHNNDYGQDKIKSISLEDDLIDVISIAPNINKTDAQNLVSNFQNIKSIVNSSSQLISLVPGMSSKKIKSIEEFFNFEFSKFKK